METFSLTKKMVKKISGSTYLVAFKEDIYFEPMQFVMIETPISIVRKPFALGTWQDELAICIEIIGEGSRYIVQDATILNAHGPCGKGFEIPNGKGLILASASCFSMAYEASKRWNVEVLMCSKEAFEIDVHPFKQVIGDENFLKMLKQLKGYDWYLTLGSPQMCKIAYDMLKGKGMVYTTTDAYMACGLGACKGCAIDTKEGIKHVCEDGPIFRGDILWS